MEDTENRKKELGFLNIQIRKQQYVEKRRNWMEFSAMNNGVSFDWKIKKLREYVERAMPIENERLFSPSMIQAIAELNKMEGHYAPERSICFNTSSDTQIQEAQRLAERIEKHKKDY